MSDYHYLIKLVIVGASGVGKSSLLTRFVDDTFNNEFISTIGVDFKIKTIQIGDVNVKLQIWDTAGQERFKAITTSYYRGSHAAIIAFDPYTRDGLDCIQNFYDDIKRYSGSAHIVLVSTKSELPCPLISQRTIAEVAEGLSLDYFATSARQGTGIDEVFEAIVKAKINVMKSIPRPSGSDIWTARPVDPNPKKKCCI